MEDTVMKRFMLLHVGFETPTPQIMAAWGKWFESVGDRTVENAGLRNGREITRDGTSELPMGRDALTGYTILSADSIEHAERLAAGNPFISGIRIYELATY
jgi:hypothetical protein